jgi:hypothetical protein
VRDLSLGTTPTTPSASRATTRARTKRMKRNSFHPSRASPTRARPHRPPGPPRANRRLRSSRTQRKSVRKRKTINKPRETRFPSNVARDATETRVTFKRAKKTYLGGSLGGHGGREDGGHCVCVRVLRLRVRRGDLADSAATRTWTTRRTTRPRPFACPILPKEANLTYTLHFLYP